MPLNSLLAEERLKKNTEISTVLKTGQSQFEYPFKGFYCLVESAEDNFMQLGISVAKKRIPRANNRNTIKRHIREAFRLNKHSLNSLLESQKKSLKLQVVYIGNKEFAKINLQEKIILLLKRLEQHVALPQH